MVKYNVANRTEYWLGVPASKVLRHLLACNKVYNTFAVFKNSYHGGMGLEMQKCCFEKFIDEAKNETMNSGCTTRLCMIRMNSMLLKATTNDIFWIGYQLARLSERSCWYNTNRVDMHRQIRLWGWHRYPGSYTAHFDTHSDLYHNSLLHKDRDE